MSRSTRRLAGVAIAGACIAALAAPALAAPAGDSPGKGKPQGPLMDLQILSFNDFHGNLEPISSTSSSGRLQVDPYPDFEDYNKNGNTTEIVNQRAAGGVEYLATHLAMARQGHRNTLTVAAGDIVGASPLLSAAFHDEPTIESMNKLGLDVTAVGNHEFDEGYKELQRLAYGGCIDDGGGMNHQNSCPAGPFTGANFDMLAANVVEKSTGKTILPAYSIKNVNGAKVAFIGMTLKGTPAIVTASGVAGLEFKGEVETANALVPQLKAQGVNAIIVLVHEGGSPTSGKPFDWSCGRGGTISGPIVDIAKDLSPDIDMVISGHTHQPYVCNIPDPAGNPRLVTSASSFGRLFTETNVKYDRRTQDIVRPELADSANVLVTRDVAKDPAQTALIDKYNKLLGGIADKVLGQIQGALVSRTANAAGESPLGDLIADAQLSDPSTIPSGGTAPVISFMNAGGIRSDLIAAANGDVTYRAAFTVQPFNNYLVSMDLTGQQVVDVLNQQFINSSGAPTRPYVLATSAGLTYTHDNHTVSDVKLNGTPIDVGATYRIVTNNFLSDGGDGFPRFADGKNKYFGGLDIDAFANYLSAHSPYAPGALDRVTLVP